MNVLYIINKDLLFKSFCSVINPTVASKHGSLGQG